MMFGMSTHLELNEYRVVGVQTVIVVCMITVTDISPIEISKYVGRGDVITYETSNEKFQVRPYTLGYAFRV